MTLSAFLLIGRVYSILSRFDIDAPPLARRAIRPAAGPAAPGLSPGSRQGIRATASRPPPAAAAPRRPPRAADPWPAGSGGSWTRPWTHPLGRGRTAAGGARQHSARARTCQIRTDKHLECVRRGTRRRCPLRHSVRMTCVTPRQAPRVDRRRSVDSADRGAPSSPVRSIGPAAPRPCANPHEMRGPVASAEHSPAARRRITAQVAGSLDRLRIRHVWIPRHPHTQSPGRTNSMTSRPAPCFASVHDAVLAVMH